MKRATLLIVLSALLVWVILSWLVPGQLRLSAHDTTVLRLALIAIGVIGAAAFLWLKRGAADDKAAIGSPAANDVEPIFAEAETRLRDSRLSKLNALPVVFLLGDSGATKTTTILRSGLDPELLAGQALAGDTVAPTASLNVWLTRQTLVLDPGGALLGDRPAWRKVVQRAAPTVATAFGQQKVEPRAAIVCLSCEVFAEPQAAEVLARKARQIREQLSDAARILGVSLPVYVLFTKLDQIPYFVEYVSNLNEEEAKEVLGTTLSFSGGRLGAGSGVYAENQAQILSHAFSTLYAALCERRLAYLQREHDPVKAAAIYEFPREFGKIQPVVTQFLVDLCRPSQLQVNPVLRGFYFTGVRAVTVTDMAPVAAPPRAAASPYERGATVIFQQPRVPSPEAFEQRGGASRRVPQWTYLPRIFPQVVLADRTAHESSRNNVKTSGARRALFLALSGLGLFLVTMWTVSFVANYQLATRAEDAIGVANGLRLENNRLPSPTALQQLAEVQSLAETLNEYEINGPPLYMRWGLYNGTSLESPVHRSWCTAFGRLLLEPTQADLVQLLSSPATAGGNYGSVYDALKAYLITTSYPQKSTAPFLPDVLAQHWPGRKTQIEQLGTVRREFDFYAAELAQGRTCQASVPDGRVLAVSRQYLKNRSAAVPVYQEILARVNRQPPLIFNAIYPESATVVRNEYPVPAAFTKKAWTTVQSEIGTASKYLTGDDWVLGSGSMQNVDPAALKQELQGLYRADMVKNWREYLRHTSVTRYANVKDAAQKLQILSSNQSPLLKALCLASENTTVDDKAVRALFQPPQALAPAGCTDHWSSPANESYMSGLIGLQASLNTLSTDEANETLRNDALTKATTAGQNVIAVARNFTPDIPGGVDAATEGILEAPIQYVQALIAGVPKQQANGAARGFCSQFDGLMRKFPFSSFPAAPPATMEEFEQIFKPGSGALWRLAQDNLQRSITLAGNTFLAKPGADPPPSPAFVSFLNQAGAVSGAFYHGGQQAQLSFDVRVVPDQDIESVALSIDGQTLNYSKAGGGEKHFVWPGTGPQEVKMRVKFAGGSEFDYPSYSGNLAVFRFFAYSDQWTDRGNESTVEKSLKTAGGVLTVPATGHPATVRLILDMNGGPMVLRPGYFGRLRCVGVAVQ